jgi:hypothetical protein
VTTPRRADVSPTVISCAPNAPTATRGLASLTMAKKEGDISSVFVSLSGAAPTPLAGRFADIKRQLIRSSEDSLLASWKKTAKSTCQGE